MNLFRQLLRSLGFKPRVHKSPSIEDVGQAATENALRDNEQAFAEAREVYQQIPHATGKLWAAVEKVHDSNPFSDLENLTRLKQRKGSGQ